ncbi:MAG: phage tail tape measure protein [Streptococcaceae bacterium]|jgi:TP901 family phage tail tape measure protein|nr:phage tail tape measure protein [Streptococcaceae bacterium]
MAGGTPLGRLIVELGLDDKAFSNSITNVQKRIKTLNNDLKTSQAVYSTYGKKVEGIVAPTEILNKQIQEQSTRLNQLKDRYLGSIDASGKASSKTSQYASEVSRANAQLLEMIASSKEVAKQQYLATSKAASFGSAMNNVGSKLRGAGNAMMPVSVAITAGLAQSVQAAAGFEQQFTAIRALLSDSTPADKLNGQIEKLESSSKGWATQYGIATSSINTGMEEMIKKGYNYNQTLGAMPAILDASKASGEDFNTVMSSSTSILEQFNLKANDTATMTKNTQRVTDTLSFVANKTAAGFADMGEAMEYVGPVANGVGMSLEDTASAIGLLSNNGIEGQSAGTGLRSVLTSLLRPSKQSAEAMEELGINSAEASEALKEMGINVDDVENGTLDLSDVIAKAQKATSGLNDVEKSRLLAQAFGTKGQTAMNILTHQGADALKDLSKETSSASGYTKDLADQMNNAASNDFAKAKAQLEVLSINLGQKLLPTIIPVVQGLSDLVDGFSKMPKPVQDTIIKMAGILAVSYPMLNVFGNMSSLLGGAATGFSKIKAAIAGGKAFKEASSAAGLASEALSTAGTTATAAGTAMSGAAEGAGLLSAGIGALPVALGIAGAAIAVFTIWKLTEDFRKSQEKINEWGADITDAQANKLEPMKGAFDKVTDSVVQFNAQGAPAIGGVKTALDELSTSAKKAIDDTEQAALKTLEKVGATKETVEKVTNGFEQQKTNVDTITAGIAQIYQTAADNNRELTQTEIAETQRLQSQIITSVAESAGVSGQKLIDVASAFSGNVQDMSKNSAKDLMDSVDSMMDKEVSKSKKTIKTLKDSLEVTSDKKARKEINSEIEAEEKRHNDTMLEYQKTYKEAAEKALSTKSRVNPKTGAEASEALTQIQKEFEKYGTTVEEVAKKIEKAGKTGASQIDLLAKSTSKMSQDTADANKAWNGMVLDPKTGEIKTNLPEVLQDSIKTPEGWANMQFILKNAKLTSNAKEKVAEAIIASGLWDQLTPKEQKLLVNSSPAIAAITSSKDNLNAWNEMPAELKQMLADNSDFMNKKGVAAGALESWNALTPEQKKLLAEDKTGAAVRSAKDSIAGVKDKTVTITSIFQNIVKTVTGHAKGTDYHKGGPALVNDQKGSLYRELITLPTGERFIPTARDVIMDLPRGTKVLPAKQTAKLIPKYADGVGYDVGIPADSGFLTKIKQAQQTLVMSSSQNDNTAEFRQIIQLLKNLDDGNLVQSIKKIAQRPVNVQAFLDKNSFAREITQPITDVQKFQTNRNNRLQGILN